MKTGAGPQAISRPPSPGNEGRTILGWTLLAGLLVFGAMCAPFFLGRVYTADDLGEFHLPLRDFYSRQLAAGQPWDWMPSLFCGFYLTGEGQLGGYHPLHLLLYRTLPLGAAFNLELLLNYPFIAVGTYLFLRQLGVRRDGAAFGSLVFTFSSFNLLHFVHPNAIAVVAHIPWLLWAVDILCRSPDRQPRDRQRVHLAACGIALLTGSQLLLGYPQYVWFSLLSELGYAALRLRKKRAWMRPAAGLLAATVVGGLIGAVQVLPTVDALANSTRNTVRHEFRTSGSLHPLNLVQPFAPYLLATRVAGQNTHELGMYLGCVPLVLCYGLWLNRAHWGRSARVIWPTILLGSLALLYALGEYGPLYQLQAAIPFVQSFRFPCRAIVLVELAVAVLSAIAFVQLAGKTAPWSQSLWLPAVISVSLAGFAPMVFHPFVSSIPLIAVGPMFILLATWLVSHVARGSKSARVLLVLLAAGDLAAYGLSYSVLPRTENLNTFAASAHHPQLPTKGRVAVNTGSTDSLVRYGNRLALAGYSLTDGYAGLEPAQSTDGSRADWLDRACTEWKRSDNGDWLPLGKPRPKARLESRFGEADITRNNPGSIEIATRSQQADWLTLSESFQRGWTARIDGKVVAVMPTQAGFLQCPIPPGEHVVEFQFEPASLRYGGLLTSCGLGLTMSWAALALRLSKKL